VNWLIAGLICLAAVVAEGLLSGDAAKFLKSIKEPAWALKLPVWIAIGLLYYAACFYALARLLASGLLAPAAFGAFAVLLVVMTANAAWNWVFFKRRDFRLSFYYFFPYAGLVLLFIVLMARVDLVASAIFVAYACYLPYALAWSYRVWKLN
jgi:tryptophan-rich sensory protein